MLLSLAYGGFSSAGAGGQCPQSFFFINCEYAQDQKKCFCRGPASLELDMSHKSIYGIFFTLILITAFYPSRRESVSVLAASR